MLSAVRVDAMGSTARPSPQNYRLEQSHQDPKGGGEECDRHTRPSLHRISIKQLICLSHPNQGSQVQVLPGSPMKSMTSRCGPRAFIVVGNT